MQTNCLQTEIRPPRISTIIHNKRARGIAEIRTLSAVHTWRGQLSSPFGFAILPLHTFLTLGIGMCQLNTWILPCTQVPHHLPIFIYSKIANACANGRMWFVPMMHLCCRRDATTAAIVSANNNHLHCTWIVFTLLPIFLFFSLLIPFLR